MTTPRLYAATRTGGSLLRYDVEPGEGGAPFVVLFETTPYAPGGIGGEAMFDRLHLAITHSLNEQATIRVTPIIAEYDPATRARRIVEKTPIDVDLASSPGVRTQVTRHFGLSEPYVRDGVERFRVALRGEWIAFRVETVGPRPPGDLIFDRLAFEATVMTTSDAAVNAP